MALKFGWHIHSFPVDGSSSTEFIGQLHNTLAIVEQYFDSAWMDDHVVPWAPFQSSETPHIECVTSIAYLAARYPGLMFGSSVLCQSYRNPALMAKMASSLQLWTQGRFIFGIGAGWLEEEYHAYNWDFPKPSVRIAQMVEAIEITKALWSDSPVSYAGKYYSIKDAYCEPKPEPVPPILIGGGGEQLTLRAVAKLADMWNLPGVSLDVYKHKLDVLRKHCDNVDRDYDQIVKTYSCEVTAVASTEAEAKLIVDATPYRQTKPVYGTPEQVADQLRAYVNVGVEHLIVRLVDFPKTDCIQMFAEEVLPLLR